MIEDHSSCIKVSDAGILTGKSSGNLPLCIFQYEEKYTGSLSSPVLKFVHTSEGYYDFEKNKYIYTYTDHLDRRVKEKLLRRLRTQFCTSELRQKYNQWQRRSS
jgi:hypothetical protein